MITEKILWSSDLLAAPPARSRGETCVSSPASLPKSGWGRLWSSKVARIVDKVFEPTCKSAGLLAGRVHLTGTSGTLVGGDPWVPMSLKIEFFISISIRFHHEPDRFNLGTRVLVTTWVCATGDTIRVRARLPGQRRHMRNLLPVLLRPSITLLEVPWLLCTVVLPSVLTSPC
jgi:hypothetical protein